VFALRILVSISAIGSLIVIVDYPPFLPTCFLYTRNFTFVCQFTEAYTADSIFS
jgi:hypothetical protein